MKESGHAFAALHPDLSSRVFTLTEALDHSNFGVYHPDAISHLVQELKADYLLLIGDMTIDYFGYNYDSVDYSLPAPFVWSQHMQSVSDATYAWAKPFLLLLVAVHLQL